MVGRSNVGNISLINALLKQKIARTSAAPGKTRLANYYLIEKSFYLVDLPGYGYARGGTDSVEAFEGLTTQYFEPSRQPGRQLAGVLHLVDARHPALDSDAEAHAWLSRTGARPVRLGQDHDAADDRRLRAADGGAILLHGAT